MPTTTWAGYKIVLEKVKGEAEALVVKANTPFKKFQHDLFLNQIKICLENINTVVKGMTTTGAAISNADWYNLVNLQEAAGVGEAIKHLNVRWKWMATTIYGGTVAATPPAVTTCDIYFSQVAAQSTYKSGQLTGQPVNYATLQGMVAANGLTGNEDRAIGVVCMFLPTGTTIMGKAINPAAPILVAINNAN